MNPVPTLGSNGLATFATIPSLVLATAGVRWEEEALTDMLSQKKGFFPTFSYT